jgi:hypothetical protein
MLENTEGVKKKGQSRVNIGVHKTLDKYMLENTERVIKKDNPEKLAT